LSLQKDIKYGVEHNAVLRLVAQGYTIQQAIDKVGEMLDERYNIWDAAVASLPSWGKETDEQVAKVLDLYSRTALGALHWSFHSGRYFGEKGQEVKKTREMELSMKREY
jgi:hypothetical protein